MHPGQGGTHQVGRDGSGDERVGPADQGPTEQQHGCGRGGWQGLEWSHVRWEHFWPRVPSLGAHRALHWPRRLLSVSYPIPVHGTCCRLRATGII